MPGGAAAAPRRTLGWPSGGAGWSRVGPRTVEDRVKILLIGGSGMVGTFITPYLARQHELRVLDVVPPKHADLVEYVQGSIADPDAVSRALEGMDTFVNMVMRNPGGANET